jgi:hypothetical protein
MSTELSEEEMRRALFGAEEPFAPSSVTTKAELVPEVVFTKPAATQTPKKKPAKAFTPRLRVTLRMGNEFEGKTFELIHEADTLSKLLAEQEAVKRRARNTAMSRSFQSNLCSRIIPSRLIPSPGCNILAPRNQPLSSE